MEIVVIGGGASGRLVGLEREDALVFESARESNRPDLTRNFGCNYLWEKIPHLELIPGKVLTTIDGFKPIVRRITAYKQRIGKLYDVEFAFQAKRLLQTQFRHEQDCHLVTAWPEQPRIGYGFTVKAIDPLKRTVSFANGPPVLYDVLVSTIPLPLLIDLAPEFKAKAFDFNVDLKYDPIYVEVFEDDTFTGDDQVLVDYRTEGEHLLYRVTHRGDQLHKEYLKRPHGERARQLFPGKIKPCVGARYLLSCLEVWGIYAFGRFGSWHPDELLHQTYRRIAEWARQIGT